MKVIQKLIENSNMSSASSSNSSGDEPNKKPDASNEESSHLLEANENGAKYGSRQAVKIIKVHANANGNDSANASPQVGKHIF